MNSVARSAREASRADLALAPGHAARLEQLSTPNGVTFTGLAAIYVAVWAAGVAAVASIDPSTPTHAAALLLISALLGSQLHALTVLQHDCGHRSAYRSAAANLWVGRFLALFVYMPFTTFTELHRRHHGFLGDSRQDPDHWFYAAGPGRHYLRECLFLPRFIGLSLTALPAGEVRGRVVAELAIHTAVHAGVVAGLLAIDATGVLVYGYALPMLWLACVFNPLSRGFEHAPMAGLPAGDKRRADLRHNTVTTTSRTMGALWANIGFHVEHHMYPRVPFYRLPALHRLFADKTYTIAAWPLAPLAQRTPTSAPMRPAALAWPPSPLSLLLPVSPEASESCHDRTASEGDRP